MLLLLSVTAFLTEVEIHGGKKEKHNCRLIGFEALGDSFYYGRFN